jgi:hypothetical protein
MVKKGDLDGGASADGSGEAVVVTADMMAPADAGHGDRLQPRRTEVSDMKNARMHVNCCTNTHLCASTSMLARCCKRCPQHVLGAEPRGTPSALMIHQLHVWLHANINPIAFLLACVRACVCACLCACVRACVLTGDVPRHGWHAGIRRSSG